MITIESILKNQPEWVESIEQETGKSMVDLQRITITCVCRPYNFSKFEELITNIDSRKDLRVTVKLIWTNFR